MTTLIAEAHALIDAPAALVTEILRDFDGHHRHILPKAFSDFRVIEGGVGAGTVTEFTTSLGGRRIPGRTVVSEPAEGVLREEVVGRDMVTTFRVIPRGAWSSVTIRTTWTAADGLDGTLERLFAPRMLRAIYREELERLEAYAAELQGYRAAATTGARLAPAASASATAEGASA